MKSLLAAPLILFLFASNASAQNRINVFSQVADGSFSDGSYYRTAFMILPRFETSASITCTLRLQGLSVNLLGTGHFSFYTVTVPQGGFFLRTTAADQPIDTGFAVLTCSDSVYAQALYGYYTANAVKISEATVFASNGDVGGEVSYRMIADQRGSNLGIAIANDTDVPRTYRLTLNALTQTITVPAHLSLARFLTELMPASANTVGILKVESVDFSEFYAIGLRYTGSAFTTIPAN